jgi:AcrR family transcriptional regulator
MLPAQLAGVTSLTRRLPREARRAQILDVAAGAFLAGGFDGTSMDDVARAAGVTRLIVYRIFGSKEGLYRAVLDSVLVDLAESFGTDPFERLRREGGFSGELLRVARRHPDGFRLLWRHAANEPTFAPLAESFRAFAVGYAESLLATSMNDPTIRRWAARAILSYLNDGICTWLDDGDAARDAELVAMLSSGSRALVSTWVRRGEVH